MAILCEFGNERTAGFGAHCHIDGDDDDRDYGENEIGGGLKKSTWCVF